jgi:hydroxymethylpyrimidine pyrophosphatase-like HAD family hydrolase
VDVHSNSRIVVVGDNDSDIAGLLYVKRGVRLSGGKTSVNCISMSQY